MVLIGVALVAVIGAAPPAAVIAIPLGLAAYFALDIGYREIAGDRYPEVISDAILDFFEVGTTETNKSGKYNSPPVIETLINTMGIKTETLTNMMGIKTATSINTML